MTPKEKAKDIINKMTVDMSIDKWQVKQCALVAVNEIIKILNPPCLNEFSYWQQVKTEIELL